MLKETVAYQKVVQLLKQGDPIPIDLEAELNQMGCDVAALKQTYEM